MQKKLYRSSTNKMLMGVCGGVAEYFNIDPTVVRIIWVIASIFGFAGVVVYIAGAFIIPEKPDNEIIDAE
ncbi:MAG: PspC domain-containing protein [Oscillospiraceae bacterium]|nr:PspC domain-containing protein [Oscillospiraceae bacterium]